MSGDNWGKARDGSILVWVKDEDVNSGQWRPLKLYYDRAVVVPATVRKRIKAGWFLDDALNVPDTRILKETK